MNGFGYVSCREMMGCGEMNLVVKYSGDSI